jgi:hypothetical protein
VQLAEGSFDFAKKYQRVWLRTAAAHPDTGGLSVEPSSCR